MILEDEVIDVDYSDQIESGEEDCHCDDQGNLQILNDHQGKKHCGHSKKQVLNGDGSDIGVLVVVNIDQRVREGLDSWRFIGEILHNLVHGLPSLLGCFDIVIRDSQWLVLES